MAISKEEFLRTMALAWDAAYEQGCQDTQAKIRNALGEAPKAKARAGAGGISPQKRGAQGRAPHGAIKSAVRDAIYSFPDSGRSRPEIVRHAGNKGIVIKPGSLKQAIRILKSEGEITNRDRKWFPAKATGQGKPGV